MITSDIDWMGKETVHDSSVFICVKLIGSTLWEDVVKLAVCVFSPKWCKFRLLSNFVPRCVTFKARLNPEKCDSPSEIIIDLVYLQPVNGSSSVPDQRKILLPKLFGSFRTSNQLRLDSSVSRRCCK